MGVPGFSDKIKRGTVAQISSRDNPDRINDGQLDWDFVVGPAVLDCPASWS